MAQKKKLVERNKDKKKLASFLLLNDSEVKPNESSEIRKTVNFSCNIVSLQVLSRCFAFFTVHRPAEANLYLHMTVTNSKAHWLLWSLSCTRLNIVFLELISVCIFFISAFLQTMFITVIRVNNKLQLELNLNLRGQLAQQKCLLQVEKVVSESRARVHLAFRVWNGILGIRDLTKMWCGNRENDKYLVGIRDLTAPREEEFAKIWAWDAGIFRLFVGNSGNRHDPNKRSSSQSRCCLLSSQRVCLSEGILFQPGATKVHPPPPPHVV